MRRHCSPYDIRPGGGLPKYRSPRGAGAGTVSFWRLQVLRGGDADKAKRGRCAWVKPDQLGSEPVGRGLPPAIRGEDRGFSAFVEPLGAVHRGSNSVLALTLFRLLRPCEVWP